MNLWRVPPEHIAKVWPVAGPMLERCYKRGVLGATFEELVEDIGKDLAQVWVAFEGETIFAAAATTLETTRDAKFCYVRACGGKNVREWVHLLAGIEDFAKAEGCDAVRVHGRKGWARLLPEYREPTITIEKRLS